MAFPTMQLRSSLDSDELTILPMTALDTDDPLVAVSRHIAAQPAGAFQPVGVLSTLSEPPPVWLGRAIPLAALVTSLAALSGARWRLVGTLWALSLLILATWRSSWGQVIHHEHLLVLHGAALALGPSGKRRTSEPEPHDMVPGSAVRLMCLFTVATYLLAGVAKLRLGGADWLSGDILRNHIASNAVRLELLGSSGSPFAADIAGWPLALAVAAPASVALELCSPLLLTGGRIRTVLAALLWTMHLAIALAMWISFAYHLVPMALVPFFAVERPVAWLADRVPRRP